METDGSNTILPETLARFVRAMAPGTDDVFAELAERNAERGFPTVGPEVGGLLRLLARTTGARRVFEFGSGLGYSAYWIAPALPADGELVLTDLDADNLDRARAYLERGGYADRARFEVGDALETYRSYVGPFDLVLVDNHEDRYVETFELVREDVPRGGVVCADNVMGGAVVDTERAAPALEGDAGTAGDVGAGTTAEDDSGAAAEVGEGPEGMDESTRSVVAYLRHVRDDPEFETVLLPVGEGLAVSVRT